jgi:quercetin dioxygenase-like cupin family protein
MIKHSQNSKKIQELAASYALGALGKRETKEFEKLLKEGLEVSKTELEGFRGVVDMLAYGVSPIAPSPGLKNRLLSRVRRDAHLKDKPSRYPGFSIVRASEGEWKEIAKGVSLKLLFVDREKGYGTALVRMRPGVSFPKHRHAETEECYVLDGDIEMGGQSYKTGDYIRAEAGTIHESIYSKDGCTLLILSSQRNEIIE